MSELWQVCIDNGRNRPVIDEERVRQALRALGVENPEIEDEDSEMGLWLVTLPDELANELETEGFVEVSVDGVTITGEMP